MFKFKDINSKDMSVFCKEEDFKGRAARVYEEVSIEGRDGSQFETIGYQNYEISIEMYVRDPNKLDEVLSWLDGQGSLEYENRITKCWFLSELDTEDMLGKAYKLKTKMIRSPFWFKKNDEYIQVQNEIVNEGNVYSKPLLKLQGSGEVELSINDVRFIYTFDEDNEVIIDCDEMTETYDNIIKSKNMQIGFEYPILQPGINIITIHSGNFNIFVKRKDAWL